MRLTHWPSSCQNGIDTRTLSATQPSEPSHSPRAKMTGDKVEVHNEPSSILSDGQRDDSNGTAQSGHSQANTPASDHHCKNQWWNCCCCCCSCLSINGTEKSKENKVQLSSIENYFNGDNEPPPTLEEIRTWADSFDKLMKCKIGRKVFRDFLKCEYSEENILFWLACEDLKRENDIDRIEEKARLIYDDYISILSPREVSLDSRVREIINKNMVEPTPHTFDEAQLQIYTLMHRDSYPRFINSAAYRAKTKRKERPMRQRTPGEDLRESPHGSINHCMYSRPSNGLASSNKRNSPVIHDTSSHQRDTCEQHQPSSHINHLHRACNPLASFDHPSSYCS